MAKILLIDDDPIILAVLNTFFQTRNHQIFKTLCHDEAFDLFKKNHPDVIVTDLESKTRHFAGIDVIRQIRNDNPNIPIILISATRQESDFQLALKAGASATLHKPFFAHDMEQTVDLLLKECVA